MKNTLTDEQIMNAVCTAADALDATRVSELRVGGWHATTIFDGDSGLLRLGRLIEKALQSTPPEVRRQHSGPCKECDNLEHCQSAGYCVLPLAMNSGGT